MARHLFFVLALFSIGVLLNPTARAVPDSPLCENQAANCVGRCANPGGGTNQNKCMGHCDRQVRKCLIRAHDAAR
jgi:hypothetical protein